MVIETVHIKIRKMLIYQITKRLILWLSELQRTLTQWYHVGQEHTWHPYFGSVTVLYYNEPGSPVKMACSSSEGKRPQYGPGKSCFTRKQGIAY